LAVQDDGEQVAVYFVHGLVVVGEFGCFIGISRQHNIFGAVADVDGDAAHFGEVAADVVRDGVCGESATGGFGDMEGQGAHAVDIGDVLQTAKNCAQVGGDGACRTSSVNVSLSAWAA
jgi:hypothetical protein